MLFKYLIRYLLYPILLIITFGFSYHSLNNADRSLAYDIGTHALTMVSLLMLIEMLIPLRGTWKATRSNFWRRDLPFIIIGSIGIKTADYIIAFIDKAIDFIQITTLAHLPFLLGVILAILITDFITYWIHRACHEEKGRIGRFLWRIHMPHHMPNQVNIVMQTNAHPINLFIGRTTFFLPLFFLGFSPEVIFTVAIITNLQALVSHFNVDIRVGWLNYILIGTELHRYHHSAKSSEAKNFGIVTSIWDQLFGAFYYNPGEIPESLGLEDTDLYPKETNIIGLMIYPFTRNK
jgi:sterol desaturase/sphingolipid hydroxylase (fatty acid hydroxylase superfamily)